MPNVLNTFPNLLALQGASFDQISQLPWRAFPVQSAGDGSAYFDVSYRLGAYEHAQFTTTALTVTLFRRLKRYAEKALGRDVSKCVLAVPAHWGETQLKALVAATHAAGLRPIASVSTVIAGAHGVAYWRGRATR